MTADFHENPNGPEAIFAAWLLRVEAGESPNIRALLARYPEHVRALEQLHADWMLFAPLLARAVPGKLIQEHSNLFAPLVGSESEDTREAYPPFDIAIPQVNRYKFRGVLGRGGGGIVLKIWDSKLKRVLAMKIVLGAGEEQPTSDPPRVDRRTFTRFIDEARIASQLSHPGIVPLHELDFDETGRAFFTMKLVQGLDLRHILDNIRERGAWTQTKVISVLLRVCESVAYAHARGVIHRDLKPANIMVGSHGEVYVMDWGLARVVGEEDQRDLRIKEPQAQPVKPLSRPDRPLLDPPITTLEGDVLGTPAYMSPEQAEGHQVLIGVQSDIYAIGAMLYHSLAGRMPYTTEHGPLSNYQLLDLVRRQAPSPLRRLAPSAPLELVAIAEKAMARPIAKRYQSMQDLAADLQAYLGGYVVVAYRTSSWTVIRKWIRRNPALSAALVACVTALIGIAVVSLLYARDAEAARERDAEQAALAKKSAGEIYDLSALQILDELEAEAGSLWPAYPRNVPALRAWIARAEALLYGSAPSTAIGSGRGLDGYQARLEELRRHGTPRSRGEAPDGSERPDETLLRKAREALTWMVHMLEGLPWHLSPESERKLEREIEHLDPTEALRRAITAVGLEAGGRDFSHVAEARYLAAHALEMNMDTANRHEARKAYAWALHYAGQFEEARDEMELALKEASSLQEQRAQVDLRRLEYSNLRWKDPDLRARLSRSGERIRNTVARLERRAEVLQPFEFDSAQDSWHYNQLAILVDRLTTLADAEEGLLGGVSSRFGWGMRRRLEFAESIEAQSISSEKAQKLWAEAQDAIRHSKHYGGLILPPQLGLVPLGPDRDSGLWECAHLASGRVPQRRDDGTLVISDDSAIVLVLIPGGCTRLGASDMGGETPYDSMSVRNERPVHEVYLDPYFISKYEMTQGQWLSLTNTNPCTYPEDNVTEGEVFDLRHPVESVSWNDCRQVLGWVDLILPTEAQWEHACRAGTDTVWWTGETVNTLVGSVNYFDESFRRTGGALIDTGYDLLPEDGYPVHAPIGTFPPNLFGLHEVLGNVSEWCRDEFGSYSYQAADGDGERRVAFTANQVVRGGSWADVVASMRSASRFGRNPTQKNSAVGVRPAKTVVW